MSFLPALISWLKRNRTSVRMAFVLQMVAKAAGSCFSLIWMPLLIRSMGDPLFGLFQSFQKLTRLGSLGDFGITGALSLKVGVLLGRGDDSGLRSLLASARTLFLLLSGGLCILFIGLSPWLRYWLNFAGVPGAGSMTLLFVYGGFSLWLFLIGGYFASLNYAHGTVTWPILPTILCAQILAPFFHWRLALLHAPLWVQMLPYLASAFLLTVLAWCMLKWSHPWMGALRPLACDRKEWKTLGGASWWAYLVSVGTAIYVATDFLVISAVIGTGVISMYQANYKACELAVTLIVTATFVGAPKLTQWMASPQEADRKRLLTQLKRLSAFEVVLGTGAVLGYIAFNNLFVGLWIDKAHQAPLSLQFAFAGNLAVTVCGNAGIQLSMRSGDRGLRLGGLAVAGTGLLNLALSILSVKLVSIYGETFAITGVAAATVLAQSVSSLCLGTVTCRYLGLSPVRWAARCWLLPLACTAAAAVLKLLFPNDSPAHLGMLAGCYMVIFLAVCWFAGLTREMLQSEFQKVMGMLRRGA
ncbi:MAG TPA: hypothetical protein VN873_01230 [Candidatus Angelobacter sp.]|nr:hypothetical protein [Candidatus Angelobacter sp.]